MPSAAENIELVKIRATDQVAIKTQSKDSCKFVKFVGKKIIPWTKIIKIIKHHKCPSIINKKATTS